MMRVFLDRLYLVSGWLAGLFLLAIFVLMMLLSAGQFALNVPAGEQLTADGLKRAGAEGEAVIAAYGKM
jgi:hypothetical protein